MKNWKRKLAIASVMLCGSAALGLVSLNDATVSGSANSTDGFEVKSAALRIPDETYGEGIRFTISLGNVTLPEGATTKVLLIPTKSLGGDEELTVELENTDKKTVEIAEWTTVDGEKVAYVHLYKVPSTAYTTDISIRAYIDDNDPQTAPTYTDVVKTSVADVAVEASNGLTEEEKEALQKAYLTCEVNYHNGDEIIKTTTAIYGATIEAIAEPTKDGYIFGGWWNKSGTAQWNFAETKVSSAVTNLYAKWNLDVDAAVEDARNMGGDENTLLFFDRELGAYQVEGATGNSYAYTTEKAYGNEAGSLKVDFSGTEAHNFVTFGFNNYDFNENDYIEFYVYNDTETPTLSLMFGETSESGSAYYTYSTELTKGKWTRVIGSAEWISKYNYFDFYGQAANFGSGTNVEGSVYISKVKVYSNFADLSAATGTWKIGETEFTGAVAMRPDVTGVPNDKLQRVLYQTGNAVTMRIWKHSYAGFEATLLNPIDATSDYKYISITAKGADANKFTMVPWDTNGSPKSAISVYMTREEADGFTTYIFRIKGYAAKKFRITPLGNTTETGNGSELIISNFISGDYTSLRKGSDANTLFFYDTPLGKDLVQIYYKTGQNNGESYHTTEKAYYGERGSTKVPSIKYGANSYILYKASGSVELRDTDKSFLQDSDYLVFNVYSTAERKLFFSVKSEYTTTGHKLMPNAWTRIVIPASVLVKTTNYYFLVNDVASSSNTPSSDTYDLYFSKIVRCSASEVTNLSSNATTDEWTLGSTNFVGAPTVSNYTGSNQSNSVLYAKEYLKPYLVNDELVITFTRHSDPYISLKLAKPITVEANTDMYMTVTLFNYGDDRLDKLEGLFLGSATNYLTRVSREDIGNGYAKVVFKCAAKSSTYTINNVRLDVENHTGDGAHLATQLVIKDIVVS